MTIPNWSSMRPIKKSHKILFVDVNAGFNCTLTSISLIKIKKVIDKDIHFAVTFQKKKLVQCFICQDQNQPKQWLGLTWINIWTWNFNLTSWGLGCLWLQCWWCWWMTSCDATAQNNETKISNAIRGWWPGGKEPPPGSDILEQLKSCDPEADPREKQRRSAPRLQLLLSSWMRQKMVRSCSRRRHHPDL